MLTDRTIVGPLEKISMPLAAEYQARFEALAQAGPMPSLSDLPIQDARAVYRAIRPVDPSLPVFNVEDRSIPGPAGDMPIRIYRPAGAGPFGILLYFHGGGWVIGDLDTSDSVCRELSTLASLVVVSVDYRLAPEHRFPAAVDDSYAATCWVAEHQAELNGNGKLGTAGESAGGNLATVMALLARDRQGPNLAHQCLLYPVVDSDLSRPSYVDNSQGYILETATMQWFWDTYCPASDQRQDPRLAPLHAESLAGLPPALVVTAEFDPLRDEGTVYGAALEAAGVATQHINCWGLVHDFFATAAIFDCSRGPFLKTVDILRKHLN